MCRVILTLATLLAVPLGASLDGQATRPVESTTRPVESATRPIGSTTGPIESELVSRIDSLSVILDRAVSVARVARAARSEERRRLLTARVDTVQVGPFSVVAPVQQMGLARRYFERAWARYAVIVGTERTPIEGHVFIFGRSELLRGLDAGGRSTRLTTRFMSRDRERAIGRVLGSVVADDFPADLATWAGNFLIRADPTVELEEAYRSLATTPSSAVTDCYDGALDRCWDAMGLDHQDEWATSWYTASERRSLVRRQTSSYTGARASCVLDYWDDACTELLGDRGAAAIPLPAGARMTLLAHTLSLGGPEAYTLLATGNPEVRPPPEAPLKDRLVQASGVSADSLIGSWRAATLQARPDVHGDTRRIGWSSLLWLAVLAGVSTRSTRWRLT